MRTSIAPFHRYQITLLGDYRYLPAGSKLTIASQTRAKSRVKLALNRWIFSTFRQRRTKWLLSPKSGIKIGRNFPQFQAQVSQVPFPFWASFPF